MSALHRLGPAVLAAALAACAAARPVATDPANARTASGWPEDWALRFALECAREGNDVRLCTCLAGEVQRRWTPAGFAARGPDDIEVAVLA